MFSTFSVLFSQQCAALCVNIQSIRLSALMVFVCLYHIQMDLLTSGLWLERIMCHLRLPLWDAAALLGLHPRFGHLMTTNRIIPAAELQLLWTFSQSQREFSYPGCDWSTVTRKHLSHQCPTVFTCWRAKVVTKQCRNYCIVIISFAHVNLFTDLTKMCEHDTTSSKKKKNFWFQFQHHQRLFLGTFVKLLVTITCMTATSWLHFPAKWLKWFRFESQDHNSDLISDLKLITF